MVGLNGLEPSTSRLSGARSNQLSYRPIKNSLKDIFNPVMVGMFQERQSLSKLNRIKMTRKYIQDLF